jgi:hypothetical protein
MKNANAEKILQETLFMRSPSVILSGAKDLSFSSERFFGFASE